MARTWCRPCQFRHGIGVLVLTLPESVQEPLVSGREFNLEPVP